MQQMHNKHYTAEPSAQKGMLLISEQTDTHMLCCFAGGVSTPSLELSEVEQLYILATVACYMISRHPHKYFDLHCLLSV